MRRWGHTCTAAMTIHSPQMSRSAETRWEPRAGSLYEETPLFGNIVLLFLYSMIDIHSRFIFSEEPKVYKRPSVHQVFSSAGPITG